MATFDVGMGLFTLFNVGLGFIAFYWAHLPTENYGRVW